MHEQHVHTVFIGALILSREKTWVLRHWIFFWGTKIGVVVLNSAYVISVRVIWSTWTVIGRDDMRFLGLTFVSQNCQKRWGKE